MTDARQPGNREPDGPHRTLPPQLRTALSSALATSPVQPPLPPLLPALHGNAVTPDGSPSEPTETGAFLPSPTLPETILQTLPADFLRTEIADPCLDRISPPATVVRRVPAGSRDGALSEPSGIPWL